MAIKITSGIEAINGIIAERGITAKSGVFIDSAVDPTPEDYLNEPVLIFQWPVYRDGVTPNLKFGDVAEITNIKNTRGPNKYQQASIAENNVLLRSSLYPVTGNAIYRSGGDIPGLSLWEEYEAVEMYSSTAYALSKAPQYLLSSTAYNLSQAPQYLFSSTAYCMVKL